MKVSEITIQDIADYLRLDALDPLLTPILQVSKKYISGYTGIKEGSATDEVLGVGDGIITKFKVDKTSVVLSTLVVKLDGVIKTLGTDYLVDKNLITFITAPTGTVSATYQYGLDAFEEFYIVIMILCQDMYDNRTLYVEKTNINRVVETILGAHCTNLLPTPDEVIY